MPQRFPMTHKEQHPLAKVKCERENRERVLTTRNIKALKRVIGFAFSYREQLSEESQEDLKLADDLYHHLKKELREQP
jgi:hypothetical protein